MQRNTASFIGHHPPRSKGPNPDNPVTPLVEWIVPSRHLWDTAEQAFDARQNTWRALRERSQAVEELRLVKGSREASAIFRNEELNDEEA